MRSVNILDIGCLDGSEVISLVRPADRAWLTGARIARDALRRSFGVESKRSPLEWVVARQSLRKVNPLHDQLIRGSTRLTVALVDPQLSPADRFRIEDSYRHVPNVRFLYAPVAVLPGQTSGFVSLFHPRKRQTRAVDRRRSVGASIFENKENVSHEIKWEVLGLSALEFLPHLADAMNMETSDFNLLRINAEGVEFAVLQALANLDLLRHVDAIAGSWHDMKKISQSQYSQFLEFVETHHLSLCPFSGDDVSRARFVVDFSAERQPGS